MASLRTALTAVVVGLLLLAAGGVATNAWFSTRALLDQTWRDTARMTAARTAKEAAVFLGDADPAVRMTEHLADEGLLDPNDYDAVMDHAVLMLETYPRHTWFSWADEQGALAAALWWPTEDGVELRKDLRVRQEDGQTWHRQWTRTDGEWLEVRNEYTAYDPRTRPWYIEGAKGDGVWVGPYLFLSRQQPGATYALGSRDSEGSLRGVWTSDFECGPLSAYLAGLQVEDSGRVYVVNDDGAVLGHPEGQVAGEGEVLNAADHPDAWLKTAWTHHKGTEPVAVDGLVVAVHPFPASSKVPWNVVVVVPEDELYGVARAQARQAAQLTLALLLLAVVWGLLFSRYLANAVRAVERQMGQIARFELSDVELSEKPSAFREINQMSTAHDHMKHGLRSFARYVPRQLVDQLMQGGTEATRGGSERVVTVLFCDIAGFTTLVEAGEPKVVFAALSAYLTEMDEIIEDEDGCVVQYLGDAIMAVWGAPAEDPDHAQKAVVAARRMREAIGRRIQEAPGQGWPELHTRIGLHTGPCLIGNVGAAERFSYTIVGEGVRTAEHMEGLNKKHGTQLLVSDATASRLRAPLQTEAVEPGVNRVM